MTRINCVPVEELSDKHLVAEYRELPRVFRLAKNMSERGEEPPEAHGRYKLGTGHMKSFAGRLNWLEKRFRRLVDEMLRRGFNPQYRELPVWVWYEIPERFFGVWNPSHEDLIVCRRRIIQMMPNDPKYLNNPLYSKEALGI